MTLATMGGMSRKRAPIGPSRKQTASPSITQSSSPGMAVRARRPGQLSNQAYTATMTTTLCARMMTLERERDTRDGEKDGREGFCGCTAALYISQINKSF